MKAPIVRNVEKIKDIFKIKKSPQVNNLTNAFNFILENYYYLHPVEEINFTLYSNISPHYEFHSKSINIPFDYNNTFKNLYENIQSYLNDKSSEYIIFHEIGHAIQHSSIGSSDYRFEPIELNSSLNYLFNGASVANKINHFLSDNFKESYADCYAALSLYKKSGDISVFDKIYNYRESEKKKFKTAYPNAINEYFNNEALLIFKMSLNKDESFEKIHECIQSSIVKSIFKTLVEEIKTNDSFLKEVKNFGLEFSKESVGGFLKEFKDRSNGIIQDNIDELLKDPLFNRNVDSAKPLNNIRKDGHNFLVGISANIQKIRNKSLENPLSKTVNKFC